MSRGKLRDHLFQLSYFVQRPREGRWLPKVTQLCEGTTKTPNQVVICFSGQSRLFHIHLHISPSLLNKCENVNLLFSRETSSRRVVARKWELVWSVWKITFVLWSLTFSLARAVSLSSPWHLALSLCLVLPRYPSRKGGQEKGKAHAVWRAQNWAKTALVWSPSMAPSLVRVKQREKWKRKAPRR